MLTLALSLIPFHSTSTSKPLLGGCRMDQRSSRVVARVSSHPLAPPKDVNEGAAVVSLSEWQGWGTLSPVPAMVNQVVREMTELETECGEKMMFGGLGGKLQGNIKLQEDKKHRAVYQSLQDSETKLQFFSARQIACRLLGSRGYLCQKCWLAMEDCMCSKVQACSLWNQIRFWVYMHPKDFLRQNNTGKLLWQIFGTEAASLCLFGIPELEVIMWNALQTAGKGKVWLLYPCKDATANFATDIFVHRPMTGIEGHQSQEKECIHFILIDGTWSNSTAMFSRLKTHGESIWGEDGIPCISLTTLGTSAMHTLRPQPSWDKTCTAAAAIGLLSELSTCPALSNIELNKQADAVKNTLEVLLEALTARRQRMGRSVTRKERSTLC